LNLCAAQNASGARSKLNNSQQHVDKLQSLRFCH